MKPRVESREFHPGARIIAISDIHGNLAYLLALLDKLRLTPADELVIVGDLVEKGPDSLSALRYVMKLSETHRVHMVCGNCDDWSPEIDRPTPHTDDFIRRYMNRSFGTHGLLRQMCQEAGFFVSEDMDMDAMRAALRDRFAPELDFLRTAPHIMDTPHYTFVHGGVPEGDVEEMEAWHIMKNDDFLRQGRRFDKWQIVGHTPCVLYGGDVTCANPIIDRVSRIISIDGGCVLKDDGQLNALIIPHDGSEDFFTVYYDHFPRRRVKSAQEASEKSYYIRWGDSEVEILSRGAEFSRCRHVRTGYEMDILNTDLAGESGTVKCNDCTDYRIPLEAGDEVSVVAETSRGYMIKKDGVSGWYYGELL